MKATLTMPVNEFCRAVKNNRVFPALEGVGGERNEGGRWMLQIAGGSGTCPKWAVYVIDVGKVSADRARPGFVDKDSNAAWAEVLGNAKEPTFARTGRSLNSKLREEQKNPLTEHILNSLKDERTIVIALEAPTWFPYWKAFAPAPEATSGRCSGPANGKTERWRFLEERRYHAELTDEDGYAWHGQIGAQAALRAAGLIQLVLPAIPPDLRRFRLLVSEQEAVLAGVIYLCEAFSAGRYKPPYGGNWCYKTGRKECRPDDSDEQDALWAASAIVERCFSNVRAVSMNARVLLKGGSKKDPDSARWAAVKTVPTGTPVSLMKQTKFRGEAKPQKKGTRLVLVDIPPHLAPGTRVALPTTTLSEDSDLREALAAGLTVCVPSGALAKAADGSQLVFESDTNVVLTDTTDLTMRNLDIGHWSGTAEALWPPSNPSYALRGHENVLSMWRWFVQESKGTLGGGPAVSACAVFGRKW